MVKVVLKPIDNDHKPVEVAEGKTILGRGPLLGCSDKKVSRNHAVLEINAEGEIYLTPTHVNPCFYRTKMDSSPKMMKKDKALRLEPGDVFSLLPSTFQYQILLSDNKDGSVEADTSKDGSSEQNAADASSKAKSEDEDDPEDSDPTQATPKVKSTKTGLNENGKPDPGDDDMDVPDEEDEVEEKVDSPKPKKKTNQVASAGTRGRKRVPASSPASSQEPRRKRSLPSWLIKSASQQQQDKSEDNNGETPQKEDRGKRRGRKGQSEGGNVSRSARQNRQTIQRISLEDFVVSEEDWNSEDSDGEGRRGRGTKTSKRGRRKATGDESSGSDWEAEQKSQARGGRGRDASSGSDWEASSNTRRSSRRGAMRRRTAATGDSDSGSDWETDRRKKTPVQKKPRGRRSRKRSEEEEDDEEDYDDKDNASDAGSPGRKSSGERASKGSPKKEEEEEEEEQEEVKVEKKKKREPPAAKKAAQSKAGRKSCQFGRKCYRKNAAHLEGFSHPGDSDYESPSEEAQDEKTPSSKRSKDDGADTDQKPECPYGPECYRKNAQHRRDFQHTKKGRPKREASKVAAKKAKKNKDDEDGDDGVPYDLTDDEEENEYRPDVSEEK